MKIKNVRVIDEGTEMKFILLQTEECDMDLFKGTGIRTGYKIVIQITGGIAAAGGFNFVPEYGSSLHERSREIIKESGTTNALGLYLNSTDNIKSLPDCIDVNNLRKSWTALKSKYFTIKTHLDRLYEEGVLAEEEQFKKVLFRTKILSGLNIAIVDQELKSLWTTHTSSERTQIADYLWIPFDEVEEDKWDEFVNINKLIGVEKVKYSDSIVCTKGK